MPIAYGEPAKGGLLGSRRYQLAEAIEIVGSKQREDGRWPLENRYRRKCSSIWSGWGRPAAGTPCGRCG